MKVIELIHLKTKDNIKSIETRDFHSNIYFHLNKGDYINLNDITYEIVKKVLIEEQTLIIVINDIQ